MFRYIHKIWGASHDFWGELWNRIYDLFGRNDHLAHHLGSALSSVACFVVFNAVFLFCDITGKPTWLLKYKVQEGKNEPVRDQLQIAPLISGHGVLGKKNTADNARHATFHAIYMEICVT